jgi:hypothetical protein
VSAAAVVASHRWRHVILACVDTMSLRVVAGSRSTSARDRGCAFRLRWPAHADQRGSAASVVPTRPTFWFKSNSCLRIGCG